MSLHFRPARDADLPTLIDLLADDPLGATRENPGEPLHEAYVRAFQTITKDPHNALIVAEQEDRLLGMLQLTFIPYLTHTGSWRALIEGVRVHRDARSQGIGRELFQWAIEHARQRGCRLVQLTSDKQRPEAIRFYESLGFRATHEGFKLQLEVDP